MTDESQPNKTWRYDFLTFPTRAGDYHLVPVLDACSRKITGRYFGPEQTSVAVHIAWDKALAKKGLLTEEAPRLPVTASDRGTQMMSKSTQQFFFDLGIVQSFSRPRTPTDNAACESWKATLKCERLYDATTADMAPWEVESLIDHFIHFSRKAASRHRMRYAGRAARRSSHRDHQGTGAKDGGSERATEDGGLCRGQREPMTERISVRSPVKGCGALHQLLALLHRGWRLPWQLQTTCRTSSTLGPSTRRSSADQGCGWSAYAGLSQYIDTGKWK